MGTKGAIIPFPVTFQEYSQFSWEKYFPTESVEKWECVPRNIPRNIPGIFQEWDFHPGTGLPGKVPWKKFSLPNTTVKKLFLGTVPEAFLGKSKTFAHPCTMIQKSRHFDARYIYNTVISQDRTR